MNFLYEMKIKYGYENRVQASSSEMNFLTLGAKPSFSLHSLLLISQIWNFFLHNDTTLQERQEMFSLIFHTLVLAWEEVLEFDIQLLF